MTHRLDAVTVKALPPGEYRDALVRGLVLRVRPSGSRSFSIVYSKRGRARRYTLGPLERVSLKDARNEARQLLGHVAKGADPAEVRAAEARAEVTVAGLVQEMLDTVALRPSTKAEWSRLLDKEIRKPLGNELAASLTRTRARAVLEKIAKRSAYTAHATFRVLRRAYSLAVEMDRLPASPFVRFVPPGIEGLKTSDRVLSLDDLRSLLRALRELPGQYADAVLLLLLTGVRRESVIGMRLSEIEALDSTSALWTVPESRSKSGYPHLVPLSTAARRVITARSKGFDVLFPPATGEREVMWWSHRFIYALTAKMPGVAPWRVHNLRHTMATHLQEQLGYDRDLCRLIIGHTARDGAAKIYIRALRLAERRAALEKWGEFVEGLLPRGEPGGSEEP